MAFSEPVDVTASFSNLSAAFNNLSATLSSLNTTVSVTNTTNGTGCGSWSTGNQFQINGSIVSTPPTYAWDVTPAACSHLISDSFRVEDGEIKARCSECDAEFTFEAVPGGISYVDIKSLVTDLLDDPDASTEVLGQLVALQDRLNAEQAALEEGQELLRIAREMVLKRLRKVPDETPDDLVRGELRTTSQHRNAYRTHVGGGSRA